MRGSIGGAALALCLIVAGVAAAEPPPPTDGQKAEVARLNAILRTQHRMTGDVALSGPQATLHLGSKYYFLAAGEAKQVLREWGNPPEAAEGVLGIVFPAGKSFLDDTWGAVVTYEQAGYISDKDAAKTDYDAFVDQVHKDEDARNAARQKAGFPTIHLVGWAQPPSYDATHHYLIWARDLRFGGRPEDTLNYDVRLLGRRGFLSLNLVSTMPELASVKTDAANLAADAAFNPGSLYTDYDPHTDNKAAYGVAGLVAAGLGLAVAHKLGLLAVVALFAKKLAILGVALFGGVAAWFRKLFNRKPQP